MDVFQRNVPLSTQIADRLRERIAGGMYPVGSKLPTELELTRELGVSRNTVREATRSLVHSGLLSARAGDGTYVQTDSELAPALSRRVERCRDDDVAEVRSMLERANARHAAERASDGDLRLMRAALDARDASVEPAVYIANDLGFHRAIAAASGNALLADLYRGLEDIEAHVTRVTPTGERFASYLKQTHALNEAHGRLLAAIEARDPDAAEQIAAELIALSHDLQPAEDTSTESDSTAKQAR
jgi:DNA-binding FadR family transcriptional regulator